MHRNTRGNGIKFHRDNTKSLLSLNSLPADNIIDNVNKEPGSFSTSFVTGCLHNVHFCFSCDFLDVTQKPRTGMQRSRCRHKHTHICAAQHSGAQDTLEFAQTEAACPWVGHPSAEGGVGLWETGGRRGTKHSDSYGIPWSQRCLPSWSSLRRCHMFFATFVFEFVFVLKS